MLRVWTIVWFGNLAGALGTAALAFLSGQHAFGHGAVGAAALSVAAAKAGMPAAQAFFLGILCNVLVCLAIWLAMGARGVADKIAAVALPISAFVAAGFEHCVANMYFVPLGLLIQWGASDAFWADVGRDFPVIDAGGFIVNLGAVTFGNWIGGAVLVGAVYWFIYRRPSVRAPT